MTSWRFLSGSNYNTDDKQTEERQPRVGLKEDTGG